MRERTAIVTGCRGFMASHIIPRLIDDGYQILGLDTRIDAPKNTGSYTETLVDITDYDAIEKVMKTYDFGEFNCFIHLAAIAAPDLAKRDPKKAYDVNVLGTYNALKCASKAPVNRFVLLSSAHVYGISPKFLPTPETAPLQLHDTYTVTKILDENLCRLFYENFNLPYVALRLFNGYGPRQTKDYFFPAMLAKAKTGRIVLKGAQTTKDFIYIDDVIDAILAGMKSTYVGEINVGSGVQTTLEHMARAAAEAFNAEFSLDQDQPPPSYMQANIQRIMNVLKWKPKVSLDEGITKTIDWYKKNEIP